MGLGDGGCGIWVRWCGGVGLGLGDGGRERWRMCGGRGYLWRESVKGIPWLINDNLRGQSQWVVSVVVDEHIGHEISLMFQVQLD